jgi:hypothetical protein
VSGVTVFTLEPLIFRMSDTFMVAPPRVQDPSTIPMPQIYGFRMSAALGKMSQSPAATSIGQAGQNDAGRLGVGARLNLRL